MVKRTDIEEFFKKSEDYIILKIENHLTIADFGLEDSKGLDIRRDYKSLLYMINYLSIEKSFPSITGFGDFLEELLSYLYKNNKNVISLLKNKIIENKNYLNFSEYIEKEGWAFISKKFSLNKNIIHNNIKCGNNNPIKLNKIIEKALLEIAEYLVLSLIYVNNIYNNLRG